MVAARARLSAEIQNPVSAMPSGSNTRSASTSGKDLPSIRDTRMPSTSVLWL